MVFDDPVVPVTKDREGVFRAGNKMRLLKLAGSLAAAKLADDAVDSGAHAMAAKTYSDRIRPLLTLGEPRGSTLGSRTAAPDLQMYKDMGIAEEHAPDLIAMATDKQLHRSPEPACFASVHAWRALAHLGSEAAIRPLIDLLDFAANSDDDWGLEEIPVVLAILGPAALPHLKRALPDQRRPLWARVAFGRAMAEIAHRDPAVRHEVVEALTKQLDLARYNDPGLNGSLIAKLIELKGVESARAIQRAYEGDFVDEMVCGPLKRVLMDLGVVAGRVPIPESGGIDKHILDEVMREYNAKIEAVGPRDKPMTRGEHEQAMREPTTMLKARLGGDASPEPDHDGPKLRAQELAYRALDSDSIKESLRLAEQALALDPDCVDARMLRAERTITDPEALIAACKNAVAAGDRSLGEKFFEDNVGEFWGILETRPYMRARAKLANLLRHRPGRLAEAISHYEAMLDLNASDNMGLRYALLGCYLEQGRADATAALMDRFDEESAFFLWDKALMHKLAGNTAAAARALKKARRENPHVEPLLWEIKPMPRSRPGAYSWGSPEEAYFVAENILPAIRQRPELAAWMSSKKA